MVVFGMTGELIQFDSLDIFCFCSVAAFGSGALLPALFIGLSGVPGLTGVASCDASDARKSVLVLPSLDGRTRLISGLIVCFSPVGATGVARDTDAAGTGIGMPQILQKRAPAASSLLHLEQRFISYSHAHNVSAWSHLSRN